MDGLLGKAKRKYREKGLIALFKRGIWFGYDNYFRPFLPKQIVSYNGVPVRAAHWGDAFIHWHSTNISGYEGALVRGIRKHVEKGDTVVIVGGGWGVSTVAAAEQTGKSGRIITFEGGRDTVENVEETIRLNNVAERVSVRHAIVARAVSLRGDEGGAKTVSPTALPECDVLVLDCEGAELNIIEQMEIRPRTLIVETHGMFGTTEAKVRDRLTNAGYEPSASEVAEERLRDVCEEKGIYVICAKSEHLLPNDVSQ